MSNVNAGYLGLITTKREPNKRQRNGIVIKNRITGNSRDELLEDVVVNIRAPQNMGSDYDSAAEFPENKLHIVDARNANRVDRDLVLDRLFNRRDREALNAAAYSSPEAARVAESGQKPDEAEKVEPIASEKAVDGTEAVVFKVPKRKLKNKIRIEGERIEGESQHAPPAAEETAEKAEPPVAAAEEEPAREPPEEEPAAAAEPAKPAAGLVLGQVVKIRRPRKTLKARSADGPAPADAIDLQKARVGDLDIPRRIPTEREKVIVKASSYYMNNRKIFVQRLNEMFSPYLDELRGKQDNISCAKSNSTDAFEMMTHQKIVRDYINLYTPYRGLLLYHNLGTGKTCTSIAIAEGMKSHKRVFILTPASLKMNFFSQLKTCGDLMYKRNQFWEFVSVEGKPEYVDVLEKTLNIGRDYIQKNGGAWLVNITKMPNYSELSSDDQKQVEAQLDMMIRSKYTDINYNGLTRAQLKLMTEDYTKNPFDDSVVVIDEAHNFVSRIINKLPKSSNLKVNAKWMDSVAYKLYHFLLSASNARVVLLTGTPIINYPHEVGVLFNILRGYIKTWKFPVNIETSRKINTDAILELFAREGFNTYDYVLLSGGVLTITRNPFGFINASKDRNGPRETGGRYTKKSAIAGSSPKDDRRRTKKVRASAGGAREEGGGENADSEEIARGAHEGGAGEFEDYGGVVLDETGNVSDADFENTVIRIMKTNGINVIDNNITIEMNKCLPDYQQEFINMFVDVESKKMINETVFKKRILGLTSYFRSAQEKLLPSYVENENGGIFHIVKCIMSDHQFGVYEKIRIAEINEEKRSQTAKSKQSKQGGDDLFNVSSTYRIFSRAACNFAFPDSIERPRPPKKNDPEDAENIDENDFDAITREMERNSDDYIEDGDEEEAGDRSKSVDEIETYNDKIENAMKAINTPEYLSLENMHIYSPKFVSLVENIADERNKGLHLIYTQFRKIEGVGLIRSVLKLNGFAEFKLMKSREGAHAWQIEGMAAEDEGKPRFVLYTGSETAEEKEIIRNIYNGNWDTVPASISDKLRERSNSNMYGEIIKMMIITASGAEGINLKNTRFVHIVEPYWNMVRIEQVVGRARRICSHEELPEELRNIKVFLYVSAMSQIQMKDDKHIQLLMHDISRLDDKTPVTTDETLFEMSVIKDRINQNILNSIKETAIDCSLYADNRKETHLVCYGYGKVVSNQFGSYPSLQMDEIEGSVKNIQKEQLALRKVVMNGIEYRWDDRTGYMYDTESVNRAKITGEDILCVGKLVRDKDQWRFEKDVTAET
jgi:hypothetical protein